MDRVPGGETLTFDGETNRARGSTLASLLRPGPATQRINPIPANHFAANRVRRVNGRFATPTFRLISSIGISDSPCRRIASQNRETPDVTFSG